MKCILLNVWILNHASIGCHLVIHFFAIVQYGKYFMITIKFNGNIKSVNASPIDNGDGGITDSGTGLRIQAV